MSEKTDKSNVTENTGVTKDTTVEEHVNRAVSNEVALSENTVFEEQSGDVEESGFGETYTDETDMISVDVNKEPVETETANIETESQTGFEDSEKKLSPGDDELREILPSSSYLAETESVYTVNLSNREISINFNTKPLDIESSIAFEIEASEIFNGEDSMWYNKLSQNVNISSDTTFGSDVLSGLNVQLNIPKVVYPEFTTYEKQIVVATLSEVFKQLKVIQKCLPFPKFSWQQVCVSTDTYLKTIMGQIPERIFSDYHEFENSLLWKMQVDLFELSNVIHACIKDIYFKDMYSPLLRFLEEARYITYQEDVVELENVYLMKLARAFRKKFLRKDKEYNTIDMEETEFETEEEKLYDTKIWIQVEKRYIEAWEEARRIQNTMKIEKQENGLVSILSDLAHKQQSETRISSEIETFLQSAISDLETKLNEWIERYNTELEERDIELTQMNAEKDSIDNRMKTMLVTYNEREVKVLELREFFAEKEREEEIKFQQNKGATIIQKWWRRYLKIKKNFLYQQKMLKKLAKELKAQAKAAKAAKKK